MPRLFRTLLIAIGVLALACLTFVALQPAQFEVVRSVTILAPPEKVFPHVNNLRNWSAWSPWAELDPDQKVEFEGPEEGYAAIMKWRGNSNVGRGGMAIIESKPSSSVKYRLDFAEPYESTSFASFDLAPSEDGTVVTWKMWGERGLIEKAMWLLMGVQGELEKQFNAGLQNLKRVVQSAP